MELKAQMLRTIQELPDDVNFDDAMERLYLMYKVERGMEQSDRGEIVSQAEARQRMGRWLQ